MLLYSGKFKKLADKNSVVKECNILMGTIYIYTSLNKSEIKIIALGECSLGKETETNSIIKG